MSSILVYVVACFNAQTSTIFASVCYVLVLQPDNAFGLSSRVVGQYVVTLLFFSVDKTSYNIEQKSRRRSSVAERHCSGPHYQNGV